MDARLASWMAGYRRAWESNDPDHIRAIFTDDAEYRTEPYSDPWAGVEAIIEGWLEAADEPGETTFDWKPLVLVDDLAIVEATTHYAAGDKADAAVYSNLWVIRFAADGRASAYTEWWMEQPTR